jgi:3'-phosphoadenosine 5'-phosphosulfate sulfotransferase (PAPS reductase)/FAD synthetase
MDMNPYLMEDQTAIAFSGGRTSGFMLWNILQAHGGSLPDGVVACFQNTGLEHEKTLEFVRDVEVRWGVPITWLEAETEYEEGRKSPATYKVVDFCSASRKGEPFEALINARQMLPTVMARFCTVELKMRTLKRYLKQKLGWTEYDVAIGIRADEPRRVARMKGDHKGENPVMPMAMAKHTEADVLEFWKQQDFDLDLPGGDNTFGNCTGCFLKSLPKLKKIADANPDHLAWWARMEKEQGIPFRIDRPNYHEIGVELTLQGRLFDDRLDDDTIPCTCTD